MHNLIYLILALGATTVGSLSGMGGGVIIKPLMDALGDYDVQTIGVISSITVFTMALVSVFRQMKSGAEIPFKTAIPLATGSVAGGFLGQKILDFIVELTGRNDLVTIIQNIVLALLILCVFIYMKKKNSIKGKGLEGIAVCLAAGIFLGFCSSFLGIGGGPINVALIIYLFSYGTKTATICSLITILFAQISKLGTTALTTGFGVYDLSVVPIMALGAVFGGLIGAGLNKRLSEGTVEKAFNGVQLLVFMITIFNIVKSLP